MGATEPVLPLDRLPATTQQLITRWFRRSMDAMTLSEIQEFLRADLSTLRAVGPIRAARAVTSVLSALGLERPPVTDLPVDDLSTALRSRSERWSAEAADRHPRLNEQVVEALTLVDEVERLGHSLRASRLHSTARSAARTVLGEDLEALAPDHLRRILSADLVQLPRFGPKRALVTVRSIIDALRRITEGIGTSGLSAAELATQIHHEGLLPGAAARRAGLSEHQIRTLISEGTDADSMRVAKVWHYYDLAREGRTLVAIGAEHGITRERVRQLLSHYGVTTPGLRAELSRRQAQRFEERRSTVVEFVRAFPGITEDEIAHVMGIDPSDIYDLTRPVRHLILQPADPDDQLRLTRRKEQLISSLQAAAAVESPLTGSRYEEMVQAGVVPGPGRQTVFIVFGSWRAGCAAAGIDCLDAVREDYERHFDYDEILELTGDFLLDDRYHGTTADFEVFSGEVGGPSLASVRNRHAGSWTETCRQALIRLRQKWAQGDDRVDFGSWSVVI